MWSTAGENSIHLREKRRSLPTIKTKFFSYVVIPQSSKRRMTYLKPSDLFARHYQWKRQKGVVFWNNKKNTVWRIGPKWCKYPATAIFAGNKTGIPVILLQVNRAAMEGLKVFLTITKKELIHAQYSSTREQARQTTFKYVNIYYNNKRYQIRWHNQQYWSGQ